MWLAGGDDTVADDDNVDVDDVVDVDAVDDGNEDGDDCADYDSDDADDDGDGFQLQLGELQLGWRPLETCGSELGVASTMAAITLQHRSHNQLHQNTPAP